MNKVHETISKRRPPDHLQKHEKTIKLVNLKLIIGPKETIINYNVDIAGRLIASITFFACKVENHCSREYLRSS
jgi:hypothetical protein